MLIEPRRLSAISRVEEKTPIRSARTRKNGVGVMKAGRGDRTKTAPTSESAGDLRSGPEGTRIRSTWMRNFRLGGGPPLWVILKGR